ncbi:hypothetical protein [Paenibacillus abyssi]|nr:hypothetical protein [Paenibacillus abyssi]
MKQELLKVIEFPEEYVVVYDDSEEDWVAKFDKAWPEAREWAYHMVDIHNERRS